MSDNLQYGGQAVVEGVMMRSPRFFAIACRRPDGTLVVQEEPVDGSFVAKLRWMNRPFLRGTLALLDAMALGMKALQFAANVQAAAITPAPDSRKPGSEGGSSRVNDIAIGATMVFAICFGVALFVALPTALTQLVKFLLHIGHAPILLNVVDGVIRIAIFLTYISAISMIENVRRVFQYHGAEHKAINTFEDGADLTLENALASSRIHPRCGTSFIVVVLIASVIVHSLFPRPDNPFVRIGLHISLIPLVAGVAYETIKLAGRHRGSWLTRVLLAPGLWSQRLTTREPDSSMVEVALAALRAVVRREQQEEQKEQAVAAG